MTSKTLSLSDLYVAVSSRYIKHGKSSKNDTFFLSTYVKSELELIVLSWVGFPFIKHYLDGLKDGRNKILQRFLSLENL